MNEKITMFTGADMVIWTIIPYYIYYTLFYITGGRLKSLNTLYFFMFTHRELMFTALELVFTALELMFTVLEHKILRTYRWLPSAESTKCFGVFLSRDFILLLFRPLLAWMTELSRWRVHHHRSDHKGERRLGYNILCLLHIISIKKRTFVADYSKQ
jgi:hypothetical protein